MSSGYETDERSSLGKFFDRRLWRMQEEEFGAAVEKIEQASSAKIFSGTARGA